MNKNKATNKMATDNENAKNQIDRIMSKSKGKEFVLDRVVRKELCEKVRMEVRPCECE